MSFVRERPSTTRLVALMLVAGLAIVATAGIAGGALKAKRAEITLAPGEQGTVSAKCKRGTRAASGGFNVPRFAADSTTFLLTTGSVRSGNRTWSSSGENASSSTADATLVNFAYCSGELAKLKVRSAASTTVPNDDQEVLNVRCPKGGEAISGGFETPGSGQNQVGLFESRRVGKRTWTVTGHGTSLSEARLNAFAYCAKDKLGLRKKLASTSTDQDLTEVIAKARCKKGQRAVSGGFELDADFDAGAYVTPFQSRRAGKRGWKAGAANYSGDLPVNWNVYAYCI